jgi:hypothetical protein
VICSTAGFKAKGPVRDRPFFGKRRAEAGSATVSKLAPGFEKGGDIGKLLRVLRLLVLLSHDEILKVWTA